jgi:hypothetical protein
LRFFRVHSIFRGVDEGGEKLDWGYIVSALLHFIIVTTPSPPLRCLYGHNNNENINMNCEAFNQQRFICNIPTLKLYNKNVSFLIFFKGDSYGGDQVAQRGHRVGEGEEGRKPLQKRGLEGRAAGPRSRVRYCTTYRVQTDTNRQTDRQKET